MLNHSKATMFSVATLAVAVPFGACQAEKQDAEHTNRGDVDTTAGHVTAMPDNFANVVDKCRAGLPFRIFVTSHAEEKPPAVVVVRDESCARR